MKAPYRGKRPRPEDDFKDPPPMAVVPTPELTPLAAMRAQVEATVRAQLDVNRMGAGAAQAAEPPAEGEGGARVYYDAYEQKLCVEKLDDPRGVYGQAEAPARMGNYQKQQLLAGAANQMPLPGAPGAPGNPLHQWQPSPVAYPLQQLQEWAAAARAAEADEADAQRKKLAAEFKQKVAEFKEKQGQDMGVGAGEIVDVPTPAPNADHALGDPRHSVPHSGALLAHLPPQLLATPGFWYLSSPYTKVPYGLGLACDAVSMVAARLMALGVKVFAPIAYTHPLLTAHPEAKDWPHDFWMSLDEPFMHAACGLIEYRMAGHDKSVGMKIEREYFLASGKPTFALLPLTGRFTSL